MIFLAFQSIVNHEKIDSLYCSATLLVMRTLITGTVAYDLLLQSDGSFLDHLTETKESLSVVYLAQHFARHHGGTGANIAWNLRLLGGDPLLVATVGQDGGEYKALLHERGVDTTYIEQLNDFMTSTAIIGTDSHEHQIGYFHPGADSQGTWPSLNDERDDLSYAIMSPRDERLMDEGIAWCKSHQVPYVLDPGQRLTSYPTDSYRRAIEGSFGLIVNEYEWELTKKRLGVSEATILELTQQVIITLGENGAMLVDSSGAITVGGCMPDKVVNPTGAGDGFRAAYLYALDKGWSKTDALRLANAMGSFIVECEGTLLNQLDLDVLRSRAEQAYGEPFPAFS